MWCLSTTSDAVVGICTAAAGSWPLFGPCYQGRVGLTRIVRVLLPVDVRLSPAQVRATVRALFSRGFSPLRRGTFLPDGGGCRFHHDHIDGAAHRVRRQSSARPCVDENFRSRNCRVNGQFRQGRVNVLSTSGQRICQAPVRESSFMGVGVTSSITPSIRGKSSTSTGLAYEYRSYHVRLNGCGRAWC